MFKQLRILLTINVEKVRKKTILCFSMLTYVYVALSLGMGTSNQINIGSEAQKRTHSLHPCHPDVPN